MRFQSALLLVVAVVALPGAALETNRHWSYGGDTGPAHWAALDRDYGTCGMGKAQSPIDIRKANVRPENLPPLSFHYRASALKETNNGHTVQVDVPAGSEMVVAGHHYVLKQFHFHSPSEEMIGGKRFAMVAHLVHRDRQGHIAVVAILFRSGQPNVLLARLWHDLPQGAGQTREAGLTLNAAELLPDARGYYTYTGSLTTPPCSEGVRWFVLKSSATLSREQLAAFAKLYSRNARTVQPLNGRVVLSSK